MKHRIAFLSIVIVLLGGQAYGQDTPESRSRLSALSGVYISVDSLSLEMEDRGMTTDVIHAHVEKTLRQFGVPVLLPDAEGGIDTTQPVLYIGITALLEPGIEQCAYAIRVELTQSVKLDRSDLSAPFYAATWSSGGVGFFRRGWRQAIIDDVIAYTEVFADAYLLANLPSTPTAK